MNIEELCKRSHDTAVAKGWYEDDGRSLGDEICLFHSEVSEALEVFRDPSRKFGEIWNSEGGKPEGFPIELADLLIRIGDTAEGRKLPVVRTLCNTTIAMLGYGLEDFNTSFRKFFLDEASGVATIPEMLGVIHVDLSKAYENALESKLQRSKKQIAETVAWCLGWAMEHAGAMCRRFGWDLEAAVILKMAYNDTRPHRHGGKRV
jgi:hypothetical protein